MNTLTLDYGVFKKLIDNAGMFTGKANERFLLQYAHIFIGKNKVRVEALDGYRAIRATHTLATEYEGEDFDFYIFPNQLLNGNFETVEITKEEIKCISYRLGGNAVFTLKNPCVTGEWTALDKIYGDYKNNQPTDNSIAFNCRLIRPIMKIAEATRGAIIQMHYAESRMKPITFTLSDKERQTVYEFILLPVRSAE